MKLSPKFICFNILIRKFLLTMSKAFSQSIDWLLIPNVWIIHNNPSFEVLNMCILNAKCYIHNKRLVDDNNIEFLHFLYVIKFKLDIEHKICKMNIEWHKHLTNLYPYMTKCDTNIYFSWNKLVCYKNK